MVPILLRFTELAAIKGLKEKEKAVLQDESASIRRRLDKAKAKDMFPAFIENIQAEEAASRSKIGKLQQEIEENEKTRQTMAESLRGFLCRTPLPISATSSTPASAPIGAPDNEKIAKLEAENKEIKAELRELKELILQRNSQTPTGMEVQLLKLENSVNSQSMSNHGTSKRLRKLEEWKEGVETGDIKPYSLALERGSSQAPDLEPLRRDVKEAYGKAAEAQARAQALGDSVLILQRDFELLKNTLDGTILSQRELENTLKSMGPSIEQASDVTHRLETIERERLELKGAIATASEAKAKIQDLDTRYTALTDRYNGKMAHLESEVRQLGASDKATTTDEPSQHAGALWSVKDSIEKVESGQRSLWNNVNKLILDMPQFHESSKEVQKCLSKTDSLVTAVRSLELRYSNINSERLVKNMAAAMMEMYPSVPQIQEQVNQLRAYCNKELAALKESTQNFDLVSLDFKMSQLREEVIKKLSHVQTNLSAQGKALSEQLEETWDLKNKFQTQSDAFSELGESIPQALQQVESVTELSTKLQALSEDLTTLRDTLGGLSVSETMTGLSKQLETLSDSVDSLRSRQSAQAEVEKDSDITEKLTGLAANYQLLETRLKTQEEIDWQGVDELKSGHQTLLEELKAVKMRLESQTGKETMNELSGRLKTLSGDLQSLQTKFDKELASLKVRVDSFGHGEELSRLKSELLGRIEKFQAAVQSGLNRNPATGDDATNRISGSVGDHYRILGSAAQNQTERGHIQNRFSISRPAGDGLTTTAESSGPFFDAVSERVNDSWGDQSSYLGASPASYSEDNPETSAAGTGDRPMELRISEHDNGHLESRSGNNRAHQGSPSDVLSSSNDSVDQLSPKRATTEVPMARRIAENENGQSENGPPRKRPRQGTFSDDGRRPRPAGPGRFTNGTGSSASSDMAISKKARKKQEKRERKEQRKRQNLPH
jgi:hypothetical protein